MANMKEQIFLCYREVLNKINFKKHLIIAVVVGTLLNSINQFDILIGFDFGKINFLKIIITFIVPFSVSIYSAATINNETKK